MFGVRLTLEAKDSTISSALGVTIAAALADHVAYVLLKTPTTEMRWRPWLLLEKSSARRASWCIALTIERNPQRRLHALLETLSRLYSGEAMAEVTLDRSAPVAAIIKEHNADKTPKTWSLPYYRVQDDGIMQYVKYVCCHWRSFDTADARCLHQSLTVLLLVALQAEADGLTRGRKHLPHDRRRHCKTPDSGKGSSLSLSCWAMTGAWTRLGPIELSVVSACLTFSPTPPPLFLPAERQHGRPGVTDHGGCARPLDSAP